MIWLIGLLIITMLAGGLRVMQPQPASAQDGTNLLTNGGLERPYYGVNVGDRTAPDSWSIWVGAGEPVAYPHNDPVQVRDGDVSWNIRQGFGVFTAAGFQRVTGLSEGQALKFTAYGWAYTCNDLDTSCIIVEAPYRKSDTSAGVQMKVGIDPTGGTNPEAESVKWSTVTAPYDRWAEMSVVAEAEGSAVTVFMYTTQAAGLAFNRVYWDEASLVATEPPPPEATPTSPFVPFVAPQSVRPDGSIVHVIQPEDTLSSIAYAYSEYGVTNESIAELNEGIRPNTKWLTIGADLIILPPGSVDPVTGQLLPDDAPTFTPTPEDDAGDDVGDNGADDAPGDDAADDAAPASDTPTPTATDDDAAASADDGDTIPTDTQPLGAGLGTAVAAVPTATASPTSDAAPPDDDADDADDTVPSDTVPLGADVPADDTGAAASEPTDAPTAEPTAPPTAEPTQAPPTAEPTAPASPTPAQVADAVLLAETGAVCVTVFEDDNQNRLRDAAEGTLPDAQIILSQQGSVQNQAVYDGTDPQCIELPPGQYQVSASLPAGYGMTTQSEFAVIVSRGSQVQVPPFGGAPGYAPEPAATDASAAPDAADVVPPGAAAPKVEVKVDEDEQDEDVLDQLYEYSGLIVLGLAGVVLVGGGMAFLLLRRA